MDISVSNSSDKPIYRQIYEQLRAQIIKGALKSGECLPPIRTVATELRVSVITVKKAWEELERGGFIHTMVGRGCFVAPICENNPGEKREELARKQLEKELPYYRELGLSVEEFSALVAEIYDK